MPRSPVAPAAPVALDYAAFQTRLAPYAHLGRVVAGRHAPPGVLC